MKKRYILGIGCLGVIIVAIIAAVAICASAGNELAKDFEVRYEVTGSATTVDVTYQNEDGGTSQVSDVSLPWSVTFTGAQNQGEIGTVTCTIYQDGEQFKQSTSSGAYVIASADGTL